MSSSSSLSVHFSVKDFDEPVQLHAPSVDVADSVSVVPGPFGMLGTTTSISSLSVVFVDPLATVVPFCLTT
jgi:hypothetical protein